MTACDVAAPAPATEALAQRLAALAARALRLAGRRDEMQRRHAALIVQTGRAKGRLALRPQVESLLDRLQHAAHERAVGAYERLLTAIVADVLPGDRRIVLDLGTERGLPALDIEVARPGGREGILDGSGGSLTNVISAGLCYAALVRSAHRRFAALDEADCWLAPDRVPLFTAVIARISHEVGVQTLMISHHDPALFAGRSLVVRLVEDGAGSVRAVPDGPMPSWPPERPGLRSLRLCDFMSHRDTCVPLAPGVTALVGANNLGKSAVVAALRAAAYGQSADACIRHGAATARVEIGLEHGRVLVWERRRHGSPKVVWRRLAPDGTVAIETAGARAVPDWVTADLGIAPMDDLDVQLGHQKQPIFVLDQPPRRRAQILSVGRESGHLQAMQARYRDMVRADTEAVRRGEAELAALEQRLAALAALDAVQAALAAAQARASELAAGIEATERLAAHLAVRQTLAARQAHAARSVQALAELPAAPELADTGDLARHLRQRAAAQAAQQAARAHAAALAALPAQAPEPAPTADLAQCLARLEALTTAAAEERGRLARLEEAGTAAAAERARLAARIGRRCPLCGQPLAGADHPPAPHPPVRPCPGAAP